MTQPDRCPECGAERSAGDLPPLPDPPGDRSEPGPDRSRPSSPADTTDSPATRRPRPASWTRSPPRSAPSPASCSATRRPARSPGPIVRPQGGDDDDRSIRYRIDGEIARGGMGAVLKGRDPDLGRDVALKVLRDDLRDDADMVRRFVEEAQIGGQLQHPGIVPIYELGTFADRQALLRHEAGQGPHPGAVARGPRRPRRRPAPLPLHLRGHRPDRRLRPRPRRDPPRPQAVQRHGRQLRRGPGDGLGPGQGPAPRRRGGRREGRQARSPGDGHRHGPQRLGRARPVPRRLGDGHAGLHGPRAGPRRGRPGRRARRRLRPGLDPLRGPHRRAGLPGPILRRDPAQGGAGRHWPTPSPAWTPAGPTPS